MEGAIRLFVSGAAREIRNAAGEGERDCRSGRFNLIEAAAVFAALEFAIWGLVAPLGVAAGSRLAAVAGHGLIGLCLLHMLVLSPWLHCDTAQAWGLPRRGSLRVRLLHGAPAERREARRAIAAIALGLAIAMWQGWPNLLARLGIRRHFQASFEWLTGTAEGVALGIALALLTLLPALPLALRLDNLGRSLRVWAPVAGVFWLLVPALAIAYAAVTGDRSGLRPERWLEIHPDRTSLIFYLLWSFVQQALFLAFFNARLRRGFGPQRRGPLSARALTAIANGCLFGFLHLPLLPLATLTALEGAALAWYFQCDDTRNLFVVAAIHAVAGTLFAAMLPVSTNIGPWS